MAKKAPAKDRQPPDSCPRCGQLEEELLRHEQRSYDRLREISDVCADLQNTQAEAAARRGEALERLKALREKLSPA